MVERYYNEDKTAMAVVVSNGYGAGWSTWNEGYEEPFQIAYDKRVVEFWITHHDEEFIKKISRDIFNYDEAGCANELEEFLDSIGYGGVYTGGYNGLDITWVPVGSRFAITEYDGSEGLYILDTNDFALA